MRLHTDAHNELATGTAKMRPVRWKPWSERLFLAKLMLALVLIGWLALSRKLNLRRLIAHFVDGLSTSPRPIYQAGPPLWRDQMEIREENEAPG